MAEVVIQAPVSEVWAVVQQVERYSEWNPLIRWAHGQAVPGSRIQMQICPPGLMERTVWVEVLTVEQEREFRWVGKWGMRGILDGDHQFLLEPVGTDQTRVVQLETFRGILSLPLGPMLGRQMRPAFEALNEALRLRCERSTSSALPAHQVVGHP